MNIVGEFWERCQQHEFCLGHCHSCGRAHYYPQALCPHCGSMEVSLQPSKGDGAVVTCTQVMTPFYPDGSPFELPYTVVLVQLSEGVQVLSKMKTHTPTMQQGVQVRIDFQDARNRLIPVFVETATP